MAQGTWLPDSEANAKLQADHALSMPGVKEWWKDFTSDAKHYKPMPVTELNSSSEPYAGVLREAYNSPDNKTIFGQSKPIRMPYTSEKYGDGTLYINSQTDGEVRFIPTELNQASYAKTRAQLGLVDAVNTAVQYLGIGAVGVQGTKARLQQRKAAGLMEAKEGPYIDVKPIPSTGSKPKTSSALKPQQTAENVGYDAGWVALHRLSKDSPYTASKLAKAAKNVGLQMRWEDPSTIDLGVIDPKYTKGFIPFNTLPPERQSQIRQQYNVQQRMADRAINYSLEKWRELMASGPHNITKSGILYPSPEFKRHIGIIRDFLGEPPERHHAQLKVADAMARLRLKELGNEQDLRIYDSIFDIMGMPGGGVMYGSRQELILLDKPFHGEQHKGLREAGLEPTGRPADKLKKLFSTMNATEVVQYMIQLRLDTVPFNKKARAHAYMLLREAQR